MKPPTEEMATLHHLALLGNMRRIKAQARRIETLGEQYIPFARRLHQLAEGFEEQAILALVERHMDDHKERDEHELE